MTSTLDQVTAAAAAIANARAGRRVHQPSKNVLDVLPDKLLDEVMEDARAALAAAGAVAPPTLTFPPELTDELRAVPAEWPEDLRIRELPIGVAA